MNRKTRTVLWVAAIALLKMLRFVAYVLLLLIGRILQPIAGLAIGIGMIVFLFCFFFMRDQTTIMLGGGALAVAAVVVQVLYDSALRLVAPAGVVIVSEV